MRLSIRLQQESFDPGAEANAFLEQSKGAGAAVTFTGLVRSTEDAPIDSLTLEHYPALAKAQLTRLGEEAIKRFDLLALTAIHRYGKLLPEEPIVQVMALAPHRQAAFDGANFMMDWLKTEAPFWKKEDGPEGEHWVKAEAHDDAARKKWETS